MLTDCDRDVVLFKVEQITAAFYTQLLPSSTYPIRSELRQLVYTSLVD